MCPLFRLLPVLLLPVLLLAVPSSAPAETAPAACPRDAASPAEVAEVARCWYRLERAEPAAGRVMLETLARRRAFVGWASYFLGRLSAESEIAAEHFERAAEAFAGSGDADAEVGARYELIARRPADADSAARQARRVRELARGASSTPALRAWAALFEGRADIITSTELERALTRFEEAAASEAAPPQVRRDAWMGIANASLELGRLERASHAYEKAGELSRQLGHGEGEGAAQYGRLRVLVEELDETPDDARRQRAIDLARAGAAASRAARRPARELKNLLVLGALVEARETAAVFERCLELATEAQDRSQCRLGWARRLVATEPETALRWVEDDLSELAARGETGGGDALVEAQLWQARTRIFWAGDARRAGLEAELAISERALAAIERLRDRQSGESGRAEWFSTWSDSFLWVSGRLLALHAAGEQRALEPAFELAERRRSRVLGERLGVAAGGSISLPGLRSRLAADQALLAFQLAPGTGWTREPGGGSWLVTITRDAVRVDGLRERAELRRLVRLARARLEARDGSEQATLQRLAAELLAATLPSLPRGVRRLVIVPDDALALVPFAALPVGPEETLGTRYELTLAPSATLWAFWRERPPGAAPGRGVIALAAPRLEPEVAGLELPPLPRARSEAQRVAALLEGGRARTEEEASESWLKRAPLAGLGVLHLATHARALDGDAARSALFLTPGTGEDGRLTPAEIAALRLDGTAVVLSACHTAAGPVLRGEGVLSLVRAFHAAGAPVVIASPSALEDREAERLIVELYRGLARGQTFTAALRAAQKNRRAAGAPTADWAGLAAWGDGERGFYTGGEANSRVSGRWPLWLAGGLMLVGIGAVAWLRRAGRPARPRSNAPATADADEGRD